MGLVDLTVLHSDPNSALSWEILLKRYGSFTWTGIVPLTLFAYLLGHLLSFSSSVLVQKHALWRHGHPAKFLIYGHSVKYLSTDGGAAPRWSAVLRVLTFILLWPISLLDTLFTVYIPLAKNYIRPFDKMVYDAIGSAVAELWIRLGLSDELTDTPPWSHNIEQLALHCSLEGAPVHLALMRNYVVLYGFLRSICLLLVVACWVLLVHVIMSPSSLTVWIWLVSGVLVTFLSYTAFLKFWIRYHKDAMMAFVASFAKAGGINQLDN